MTIPKKFIPIGMIAGAVILGGSLGGLLVAPKILAAKFGPPPGQVEEKKHEKKKGGKKGEEAALFEIKNIIVNPAGSQGTHFLMASVALKVEDSGVDEEMRGQEVQIRDLVISTLEAKTMEVLTTPGARDELKRELAENVQMLLETQEEIEVFLPQFLIQ
jgi:flagellar FliL protein